jgi:hypothetical protein
MIDAIIPELRGRGECEECKKIRQIIVLRIDYGPMTPLNWYRLCKDCVGSDMRELLDEDYARLDEFPKDMRSWDRLREHNLYHKWENRFEMVRFMEKWEKEDDKSGFWAEFCSEFGIKDKNEDEEVVWE